MLSLKRENITVVRLDGTNVVVTAVVVDVVVDVVVVADDSMLQLWLVGGTEKLKPERLSNKSHFRESSRFPWHNCD